MKKKYDKAIKILNIILIPFKIVLVLFIALQMFGYFSKVFINDEVDHNQSFYSLPKDSMDVLVLGSSHAEYSTVPGYIYQDTGLYSYVLASACQPLEVSYEFLKDALKTQSPKVVVLEVYTAMPLRVVCEADSSYIIAQYMMRGQEKYNTLSYLDDEKEMSYYNELFTNHNQWKNADSIEDWLIDGKLLLDYKHLEPTLGNHPLYRGPAENYWYASTYEHVDEVELDDLDLESLNNIYELCKQEGIELVLYKTPIDGIDQENYNYLHAVWKWAEENDVSYIDYIALQEELNYRMWIHSDSFHAYANGAEILSSYLGEYLVDNYEFDHKQNEDLDKIYEASSNYVMLFFIESEVDPYRSIERISTYSDLVFVRYNSSEFDIEPWYKEQLIKLFDNKTDLTSDFYAIIDNNEVVYSSNDKVEMEYLNHDIYIDSESIMINGEPLPIKGEFSMVFTNKDISAKTIKNIEYRGFVWEYGYDNYKNNNID